MNTGDGATNTNDGAMNTGDGATDSDVTAYLCPVCEYVNIVGLESGDVIIC